MLSKEASSIIYWVFGMTRTGIGMMVRVFANGLGNLGSIPGRVIPKTQKMVLDATLLNSQHYKVRIKGKVEQSREKSSALHLGVVAIEKGAFGSPSTMVANFTYTSIYLSKHYEPITFQRKVDFLRNEKSPNIFFFIK